MSKTTEQKKEICTPGGVLACGEYKQGETYSVDASVANKLIKSGKMVAVVKEK